MFQLYLPRPSLYVSILSQLSSPCAKMSSVSGLRERAALFICITSQQQVRDSNKRGGWRERERGKQFCNRTRWTNLPIWYLSSSSSFSSFLIVHKIAVHLLEDVKMERGFEGGSTLWPRSHPQYTRRRAMHCSWKEQGMILIKWIRNLHNGFWFILQANCKI